MFTGIITEIGKVTSRTQNKLSVYAPNSARELKCGDSISVNGVCLTVTDNSLNIFSANLLTETIKNTNLGRLRSGDLVNLELPIKAGDRLGGHVVTGHVDYTGKLAKRYKRGNDVVFEIALHTKDIKNIKQKGSVAVNGVSLTIVNVTGNKFTVNLIPHTLNNTNLKLCRPGSIVNVETDKYLS